MKYETITQLFTYIEDGKYIAKVYINFEMFALKATQFTLTKNPNCSGFCAKDDTSGSIFFAMNKADQILLNFHYSISCATSLLKNVSVTNSTFILSCAYQGRLRIKCSHLLSSDFTTYGCECFRARA